LLTGVQHGLEGEIDTALGEAQFNGAFITALLKGLAIDMGLGGPGGRAIRGEHGAQFLPPGVDLTLDGIETVHGLPAGEQRVGVTLHCILLVALADDADGFESKLKSFHTGL
jgi:hypothetical protein